MEISEIKGFFGKWRFLSNFWLVEIEFEGIKYPSLENAYQAAKTSDISIRKKLASMKPGKAKKEVKYIVTDKRPDFDDIRLELVRSLLKLKFKNPEMKALLLSTGTSYLEESNYWEDTYWGVCRGVGENNLGKLLMEIRDELSKN